MWVLFLIQSEVGEVPDGIVPGRLRLPQVVIVLGLLLSLNLVSLPLADFSQLGVNLLLAPTGYPFRGAFRGQVHNELLRVVANLPDGPGGVLTKALKGLMLPLEFGAVPLGLLPGLGHLAFFVLKGCPLLGDFVLSVPL